MSVANSKSEIRSGDDGLSQKRTLCDDGQIADLDRRRNQNRKLTRGERKRRRREISQSYWAREQEETSSVPLSERLVAVRQYGDFSLAYSTAVQPRLEHFQTSLGIQSFRKRWGLTFALGDPLCAAKDRRAFLETLVDSGSRPAFCQISESTADELASMGYTVNEMGVDTSIDLANYDFRGKSKEWLRYASNWVGRRSYRIVESEFSALNVAEIEAVSEAWRKTRTVKRKEVRFLNRPIVLEDEPDVRKFFLLDANEKVVAFVFLDPLYHSGEITGYVTSIKRRLPDAPIYAEQAIMKSIIETLQLERINTLKLGLSPCAWIEESNYRESRLRRWLFRNAFHSKLMNQYAYNMLGHANYKRRFRGREEKVYFATPAKDHPLRLYALIALCGIA